MRNKEYRLIWRYNINVESIRRRRKSSKSISLNGKFKLTDPILFYKSMFYMFSSALSFWLHVWTYFEMFYMYWMKMYFQMKRDWVLEEKNVICENDNIIWNYVWMHAKA
jgi:hypothetical protein